MLAYEQFERVINDLQDNQNKLEKIAEALQWDNAFELSLSGTVVDLLHYIFKDEGEWVSYWMYERDFGRDWKDGCATESDGTNIDLSTTRELYDFLVKNAQEA